MRKVVELAFLFTVAVLPPAGAEPISGRVVGVADGDTITALDNQLHQYKVRLAGIDAPEKKQDYGLRSKQNLGAVVFGRSAIIDRREG